MQAGLGIVPRAISIASLFRVLASLLVISAAIPALGAAQNEDLDDTSWESDDDCFIAGLAFHSDGTVDIDYSNGDDDTGAWALYGDSVHIEFDNFDDVFLGHYGNGAINAAHAWLEMDSDMPQTESCVFHRIKGDKPRDAQHA